MKYTFLADDIEILNVPKDVYVEFERAQRVFYGPEGSEHLAGHAKLSRTTTGVVADIILYSTMTDAAKSTEMIQKLYPAAAYNVYEGHIEIVEVFLTPHPNRDARIRPLGFRLRRRIPKKDLH